MEKLLKVNKFIKKFFIEKKKVLTEQEIKSEETIKKLEIKSLKDLKCPIGQIIKTFLEKLLETELDIIINVNHFPPQI